MMETKLQLNHRALTVGFQWLASRICAMYIIIFLILGSFVDFKNIFFSASIRTLNRLRPPEVEYLIELKNRRETPNQTRLGQFIHYYKKVYEYVPNRPDALGLLGYCYYLMGHQGTAEAFYTKALNMNDKFFWYYYNLAAIKFQNKQYSETVELLRKGLEISPETTLFFIANSLHLYMPVASVLILEEQNEEFLISQLRQGHWRSHKAIILSLLELKNYTEVLTHAAYAIHLGLDQKGEFYYYAGLASYELKEYENAIRFFEQHLLKNPNHSDSYRRIGLILSELGGPKLALKFLYQADKLKDIETDNLMEMQNFDLEIY